jgi:outer membrane protein assembly factor BamE
MNVLANHIKTLVAVLALSAAFSLPGCTVYKINVQQGNYLKDDKIAQLKVGMTRRQVQYLLGSPILQDPFHPDRWDYIFYFRNGKTNKVSKRNMVIFFDGDAVESIKLPADYVAPSA